MHNIPAVRLGHNLSCRLVPLTSCGIQANGCSSAGQLDEVAFQQLLEHDNFETRRCVIFTMLLPCVAKVDRTAHAALCRRAMLELMKDPLFKPRWNITIAEERRLALERLRMIITSGLISVTDFRTNPLRIFAAHEIAALSDVSMCADMSLNLSHFAACAVRHSTDCLHQVCAFY